MSELLSLKWKNHSSTLLKLLCNVLSKDLYCDATIACHGKYYPVHRLVLSTCSDYFKEIFDRTQCRHPFIIVNDVHPNEMEGLLNFMYRGEVNILQKSVSALVKAAEALKIKGLAVPDDDCEDEEAEKPSKVDKKRRNNSTPTPGPKRSKTLQNDGSNDDTAATYSTEGSSNDKVRPTSDRHSQPKSASFHGTEEFSTESTGDTLISETVYVRVKTEREDYADKGDAAPVKEVPVKQESVYIVPSTSADPFVESDDMQSLEPTFDPESEEEMAKPVVRSWPIGTDKSTSSDALKNISSEKLLSPDDDDDEISTPSPKPFKDDQYTGEFSGAMYAGGVDYDQPSNLSESYIAAFARSSAINEAYSSIFGGVSSHSKAYGGEFGESSTSEDVYIGEFGDHATETYSEFDESLDKSFSSEFGKISGSTEAFPSDCSDDTVPRIKNFRKAIIEPNVKVYSKEYIELKLSKEITVCPYCSVDCSTEKKMRRHIIDTHPGHNRFFCRLCSYSCKGNWHLRRHMLQHTGERPYACFICPFKTTTKQSLTYHVFSHAGVKPFKCSYCTYKSITRPSVKAHELKYHSGNLMEDDTNALSKEEEEAE